MNIDELRSRGDKTQINVKTVKHYDLSLQWRNGLVITWLAPHWVNSIRLNLNWLKSEELCQFITVCFTLTSTSSLLSHCLKSELKSEEKSEDLKKESEVNWSCSTSLKKKRKKKTKKVNRNEWRFEELGSLHQLQAAVTNKTHFYNQLIKCTSPKIVIVHTGCFRIQNLFFARGAGFFFWI